MIDPTLLRDRFDEIKVRLSSRGPDAAASLERVVALDERRRQLLPLVETLKHERKQIGERIAQAKRTGADATELVSESRDRAEKIKTLDAQLADIETDLEALLLRVPNVPHPSVPVGAGPADNQEIRRCGEPAAMTFTPRPHWEIGAELGILDFERATRMSRGRFAVLTGAGARLERALTQFMLDLHVGEHGYTEVAPPFLVNTAALTGTGNLPKFAEDLFALAGEWDLFLVPTAEVPLANLHREEILDPGRLPLKYVAYTPCFRSEAGSYGTDVRGLMRQHQFEKVELFKFTTPESSYDELESLTRDAETVLERLGLPYRTMALCTGDMGFAAAKTYDIEVWIPSQGCYREISSCSNTEAFQARRAAIRYRPDGGRAELVHTLNGSGLAVGRTLIAVLENCQQADGSVIVPEVLHPYMGGIERITRAG